jgi:signal transduction histidine kinase/CheY-like chemotaxis protein
MNQPLRDLLAENRDQIVARFVEEVRGKELSPEGVATSLLVDHVPLFLDEIIAELDAVASLRFSHDAMDTSQTARRHGGQRWRLGYDLEAVVREYGVLRHVIFEFARKSGAAVSLDEVDVLAKCLNVGVAQATAEYVRYRDQQLEAQRANLQFLAEAGQLLSSSLDYRSTLVRLTELIVPRLADWCAVHLADGSADDMPIAHVDPAKVDVVREIYRRYPLPSDSRFGYPEVLRTRQPQLMRRVAPELLEAAAHTPEHLAMLRALNARSWMVVPLQVQESMFGAITFVYGASGREYDDADVVLGVELARRAAAAIDNARLFDQSQKARSRIEAATRAKDEFVAMVSHELRTPLNAILGWTRLLQGGSLDAAKRTHALDVIERNAVAQERLVSDLLDIGAAVAGKTRVHITEVDFATIVAMAIEGARPAAEAKGIEFEVDLGGGGMMVRADGDRLQQVVWNLLSNAVKFSTKNAKVSARLARIASDVELAIADEGIGIAAEFLPHVFESFRQYDTSSKRSHGGLGIGLSIAKHIVELHGGNVEARSEGLDRGATFIVRLPVNALSSPTRESLTHVPATKPTSTEAVPLLEGEGICVLVVDDDPDARELVKTLLQLHGMKVSTASSAAEALVQLSAFAPDLIISDIGMPDVDGYEFIRSLRTLPSKHRDTPAIALTAFSSREDRERALVEGFNVHLAKPVETMMLVQAVLDLLGPGRRH